MSTDYPDGRAATVAALYALHFAAIVVGATVGFSVQSVLSGDGLTLYMILFPLDIPGPYLGAAAGTVALHWITQRRISR